MMGITKQMLKYMPIYIKTRFINKYNMLLKETELDTLNIRMKTIAFGKGSYVYKDAKKGSTADIDSFRPIIALPNSLNQYHRILTLRLHDFLTKNKYMDTTIQKGGVKGEKYSVFEQFYKVKEAVRDANTNNKSCCVLFLDVSSAFTNLNLDNLYKILEFYNVDGDFIKYLKAFYDNFQYYVVAGDVKTGLYKWQGGLLQGCAMSPILFVLAINYILTKIDRECKDVNGYTFNSANGTGVKILFSVFMDDICTVCNSVESLNIVYKKLEVLLTMLGLPINKTKTAIMICNDESPLPNEISVIQKVNTYKYLGEYITSDGTNSESFKQFINNLNAKLMRLNFQKITKETKIDLFNQHIVPFIQRKTMLMYDLTLTQKLKVLAIVKEYFTKWDYEETPNIFTNVTTIINNTTDGVIQNLDKLDEEYDQELAEHLDVVKYVYENPDIVLEYKTIDEDTGKRYKKDMDTNSTNIEACN
jgi:hypothetical protein